MNDQSKPSTESESLSPEQRLESVNTRLIKPSIETIQNMEMLRACVAYENANQQRTQILRQLTTQARALRSNDE